MFFACKPSRICARGYPVCRVAWLRYLGVGKQRLGRCKRVFHGIDDRTISQGFVAAIELESIRGPQNGKTTYRTNLGCFIVSESVLNLYLICACKSRWNYACCNTDCISQRFLWASVLHCCRVNAYEVTNLNFMPCLLESNESLFYDHQPRALGLCLLPQQSAQKGRTSMRTCWKSWFTENLWDPH